MLCHVQSFWSLVSTPSGDPRGRPEEPGAVPRQLCPAPSISWLLLFFCTAVVQSSKVVRVLSRVLLMSEGQRLSSAAGHGAAGYGVAAVWRNRVQSTGA